MVPTLPEYPVSWGNKSVSVFVHAGPADYVPLNLMGDVPAGGDPVYASEAGLKAFDVVIVCGVSSGVIRRVEVVYPNWNASGQGRAAVPVTVVFLRWMALADMTELSAHNNFSGENVRLLAIGPK